MMRICAVAVAAFLVVTTSQSSETADLLVVNKIRTNGNLPGTLAFLNRASGQVVVTVPVGNEPHENYVAEVNLPEMTVGRRISTGLGPDAMAAIRD